MNERPEDRPVYRILSLDGGGIRGVFPAAFLARLQEHLEHPIASYFDLIAGTSTGGIIAIGLGLGVSAGDILNLYEEWGPAIFDQQHGPARTWLRQRWRSARHLFGTKYSSNNLRSALAGVLHDRRLGDSSNRLLIPAWNPALERVYIYKTAHNPRLESDYKQVAIDAAMATAAAPTFLKPHLTRDFVELVDGAGFLFAERPLAIDDKANDILARGGRLVLTELLPRLAALAEWSAASAEAVGWGEPPALARLIRRR